MKIPGRPYLECMVTGSMTRGGMKGCQLAGFTWAKPKPITSSTTPTLTITTTLLNRALSVMPRTRTPAVNSSTATAGTLSRWPVATIWNPSPALNGASVKAWGKWTPMSRISPTK